jgi:hypothetical protein
MNELELDVVSAHPDYTPNAVDYDIAAELFKAKFNDYTVKVSIGADDSAFLWWTDGINEWLEHYERLSHALARFAQLQSCAESAWKKEFSSHPRYFAKMFDVFLTSCRL